VSRERTVGRRLLAGFGFCIVVLVASGILGIHALESARRDTNAQLAELSSVGSRLSASSDATLRQLALAQAELMGAAQEIAVMDSLSLLADSLRGLLLSAARLTDAERTSLERLGTLQGQIEVRLAVARAYRDVGRLDDAFRQAGENSGALDSLFKYAASISAGQAARTERTIAGIDSLVANRRKMLVLLLVLGFVVASGYGHVTWRAITSPLDRLVGAARTLGSGDLRVTVPDARADEEYRMLAVAFTDTASRLRVLMSELQREASEVSNAALALTTASQQAAESSGQISIVMTGIAGEAEGQLRNVAAARDVLQRVGATAAQLADAAGQSLEVGAEIRSTAEGTRAEIGQALDRLTRAQQVIATSAEEIERLEDASQAVERFIGAVAAVADQTNLLALNAAIEAARAGEHGRGFAVVAEEVRRLSADSTTAAQEMEGVVVTIRDQVAVAVGAFRDGVNELGDVGEVSRHASQALGKINAAVARVDDVAAAIVAAAQGAEEAAQELSRRLCATESQSGAQAAASEQAAAAAEETAAASQEVAATAHELNESAERLKCLVERFRT
jgi:methyl-accepting chemotaxis protein